MAFAWPASLGAPTIEAYNVTTGERLAGTEVEGGPRRWKMIDPTAGYRVSASWAWTEAQYSEFVRVLRDDLNDGERATDMPLRVEGAGLVAHRAHFAGGVETTWTGTFYRVRGELEVVPLPFGSVDPELLHTIIDGGTAAAPAPDTDQINAGEPGILAPTEQIDAGFPSEIA